MITKESKKVLAGEFGQTIKPSKSVKKAIGDTKPIICCPADLIEPQPEKFKIDPIVQQYKQQDGDVLSYEYSHRLRQSSSSIEKLSRQRLILQRQIQLTKAYPV